VQICLESRIFAIIVQLIKINMLKLVCSFVAILCFASITFGQYKFEKVLPGQQGKPLLDALVSNYKPLVVLDYNSARDTLFAKIFKQNDSLPCIYSDHRVLLPEGVDPTTYVYLNGSKDGINTEHAYPQSKGAVGGAKSDMNILYPSKASVNEARGNLPYGESPDNKTQKWFYKKIELTSIPTINIDLYTEQNATVFEPRESVKGDLARAVFYFYTMYKEEADVADPSFFNSQKNTLCQWHLLDPVDSLEWFRNQKIAKYQGGRKNPYILDCTLANRTFCPNYPPSCDTTVDTKILNIAAEIKVFPIPFSDKISICGQLGLINQCVVQLHDLLGNEVYSEKFETTEKYFSIESEKITALKPGIYILTIRNNAEYQNAASIKLIIKQ
jgi:endonuclease I